MKLTQFSDNKKFGLLIGSVFLIVSLFYFQKGQIVYYRYFFSGIFFILLSILIPNVLSPIRNAWMLIGHWLGFINTHLILFFIFILLFIPIGFVLKILNKNPLTKPDAKLKSYWLNKESIPSQESLRHQF